MVPSAVLSRQAPETFGLYYIGNLLMHLVPSQCPPSCCYKLTCNNYDPYILLVFLAAFAIVTCKIIVHLEVGCFSYHSWITSRSIV